MLYTIEHIDGHQIHGVWVGDNGIDAIKRMLAESGDPQEDLDYYKATPQSYSVWDFETEKPLDGPPSDELVVQCVAYENSAWTYEAVQASYEYIRWEPNSAGSHRVYVMLDS